jgi:arylsulfatase A-like enzyme/Flp pilus assembly protein TadD
MTSRVWPPDGRTTAALSIFPAAALLCTLLAIALPGALRRPDRPTADAPCKPGGSVLVVTLDTTRRDHMGFLGRSPSITPHLDALAAESVVFEDAYTVAPLTLPAHTSLFTGLYPLSHHLRDNSIAALPATTPTLATVLREAGWHTAAGVAAFVLDSSFGLAHGFDVYHDVPRDPSRRKLFMVERRADAMVDQALADLASLDQRGGPFLYWLHLFDAHYPYEAPGSTPRPAANDAEVRAEKRRLYGEEVAYVDAQLGRLLAALRQRPDWKQLTVVVAADHGESLGDGIEPTHGWFVYDPTIHIPLLVKAPNAPPHRVKSQVSLVDVTPTLLELLGVTRRDLRFDGVSLAPLVRGEKDELDDRVVAVESWYGYANFGWAPISGCVQGSWKYVQSRRERLFDRAADATERTDVVALQPARGKAMSARLDEIFRHPAASSPVESVVLDDASRQSLQRLGYVAGVIDLAQRPDASKLDDSEDHVDVIYGLEEVNQAFEEGRTDDAVKQLRKLCVLAPKAAFAHEQLATMLLTENRNDLLDEAERHLNATLAIDFQRSRTHFELGLVHMRRMKVAAAAKLADEEARQRRAAIDSYRHSLELDKNSPQTLANLALMLQLERLAIRDDEPDADARRLALLDETIAGLRHFLEVIPEDHPDRPGNAANLERLVAARQKFVEEREKR